MGVTKVWRDEKGRVHIDWELRGVTVDMLDWWFCNMDKGFVLWHPEEHKGFYWIRKPRHGNPVGAVQVAPQVWRDGSLRKPVIMWLDVEDAPQEVREVVIYDHVVIPAALSLTGEYVEGSKPIGYRVWQWEGVEIGVKGRLTAIPTQTEPSDMLYNVWAHHAQLEILNLEKFLPQLYTLWSVVKDPEINPQCCFKVIKKGNVMKYAFKLDEHGRFS